jgi:hypothetical protein
MTAVVGLGSQREIGLGLDDDDFRIRDERSLRILDQSIQRGGITLSKRNRRKTGNQE